ncbi:MAG: DUF4097 family beta strand repeat-containing protein [Gemmatimonadales bacterium]
MNGKEFWLRWRRDIVRGTVTFGVVVGLGLVITSMVRRGREEFTGLQQALHSDFLAPDRQQATPWTYTAPLAPERTLWLRSINGPIVVEPTDGRSIEVRAERTFKRSSVDSVRIVTTETANGITVCAVWPGASQACGPDGRYNREGGLHGNDVAVLLTVLLPEGVKLDASTVNGGIEVQGASAPVEAGTVNGDVQVETTRGPVRAVTVNGDVHATIRGFAGPGDVSVATVTGDAIVELPAGLDAMVDGHTVTGTIATDFPLTVTGKFASHHVRGTLGTGGRKIRLKTVTGSVSLRQLDSATVPVSPQPPVPPSPGTRRPRSGRS